MTRDEYIAWFVQEDSQLQSVRGVILDKGMPEISVHAEVGRLLTILVKSMGAKAVLEIGALGGYSSICLARGLPADGRVVSLELNPTFAAVARAQADRAGVGVQIEYRIGPAMASLESLRDEGAHFDVFFIDADKPNYPNYLSLALELLRPGALIIADNVLLQDRVLNPDIMDPSPTAMRLFNERMRSDPRLESVLLPIADGLAIARVKE